MGCDNLSTWILSFAERGGFSLKSIKKGSSQGGGFSAMGPAADVWYSPVLSVAS